jgi:hypothetical protein
MCQTQLPKQLFKMDIIVIKLLFKFWVITLNYKFPLDLFIYLFSNFIFQYMLKWLK